MTFSPYECARGRITPPKSVHMSHIEMMIQTCKLSGIVLIIFLFVSIPLRCNCAVLALASATKEKEEVIVWLEKCPSFLFPIVKCDFV